MNAFLFPGQGSQEVGMGKEVYEIIPKAAELLNTACELLGYDLKDLMFKGPIRKLTDTQYAQPAIFTCSAMHLEKTKADGIEYEYVAGHSLGEFSALYAAGVLSFEDGLKLVSMRGKAMAAQNGKGTMAAVIGLTEENLQRIIDKVVEGDKIPSVVIANLNTKMQIVISGTENGIADVESELSDKIASEDVRVKRLNVSAAFHSPQMSDASAEMIKAIDTVSMNESDIKVVSNVTGKVAENTDEIRKNLIDQMTGQVRWYDSILTLKKVGIEQFYECGNGQVLRKMNKAITLRPKCLSV